MLCEKITVKTVFFYFSFSECAILGKKFNIKEHNTKHTIMKYKIGLYIYVYVYHGFKEKIFLSKHIEIDNS